MSSCQSQTEMMCDIGLGMCVTPSPSTRCKTQTDERSMRWWWFCIMKHRKQLSWRWR